MPRALVVDARVAAGKDDAARRERADEVVTDIVGMDLAVDLRFAQPTRDELRDLRSEVEDQDAVVPSRRGLDALRPTLHRRHFSHAYLSFLRIIFRRKSSGFARD